MLMKMFRDLEESEKLPIGHVGRKQARNQIRKVYNLTSDQETKWAKKNRKVLKGYKYLDKKAFSRILRKICEAVGEKPPKMVFSSKELTYGTAGHYDGRTKEIHLPRNSGSIIVLIHELTHACGAGAHRKSFIDLELLIMEVAIQVIKQEKYLIAHPY